MNTVYIPKKLKIGFQKRSDTYTGKLAYVIYYDEKSKLRKETSWESWRDKSIDTIDLDNTPKNGFVIGKDIQRYGGYSWNSGRSMIRVWHPDDFEFEITPANLIMLMMHTDITKREIIGDCVLAWEGKDLVLLPKNSEDYRKAENTTEIIESMTTAKSISLKKAISGHAYSNQRATTRGYYIGTIKNGSYKTFKNSQNQDLFFQLKEFPLFIQETPKIEDKYSYKTVDLPQKIYKIDLPEMNQNDIEEILNQEQRKYLSSPIKDLEIIPYDERDRLFSGDSEFIDDDDPDFQKITSKNYYYGQDQNQAFYKIIGSYLLELKLMYKNYYDGGSFKIVKFNRNSENIETFIPFKTDNIRHISFSEKDLDQHLYSIFPELKQELENLFGGIHTKLKSGKPYGHSINIDFYKNTLTKNDIEATLIKKDLYKDLNSLGYGNLKIIQENGISEILQKNLFLKSIITNLYWNSDTLSRYYKSSS